MELPSYITACSRNDPNLNDCALKTAKESIHQFSIGDENRHLPPLDPVFVEEITIYIPNETGLKIVFKENYFHGLSGMQIKGLKFDFNKKTISAEAMVNLEVANKYDLSGKIMLVPLKSNGDSSIKLKNADLRIKMWYEHVTGSDGKIHWNITKHEIKYDVERAYFRLENLLGDKNIGDQINNLLNELWKEIVNKVGPTICLSLSSAVVKNLGVFLEQVSFEELFPE
ncbi:hypothetical protein evm_000751 [Chilo suppressalis]|nr:hypothetical protein evm_000751 [Chilo suppressalis]